MIDLFQNYLRLGKVKKKTPDLIEAKSLLERALGRVAYTKQTEITEKTAPFVLEDAYEAIREAAQALMSAEGFKPYSHEATISFVKEFHGSIFNEEDLFRFDRFRQLRHDSVYKAVQIRTEDAIASVLFAEPFIAKVKTILKF